MSRRHRHGVRAHPRRHRRRRLRRVVVAVISAAAVVAVDSAAAVVVDYALKVLQRKPGEPPVKRRDCFRGAESRALQQRLYLRRVRCALTRLSETRVIWG